MLLVIRVLSDALGYLGTVWHSWLSGYCPMLLAIWVLSDTLGYQHFTFCLNWYLSNVILYSFLFWLSGVCLMLLSYLGTVWCSWLSGYYLMPLAITILLFVWTILNSFSVLIVFNYIWRTINSLKRISWKAFLVFFHTRLQVYFHTML